MADGFKRGCVTKPLLFYVNSVMTLLLGAFTHTQSMGPCHPQQQMTGDNFNA